MRAQQKFTAGIAIAVFSASLAACRYQYYGAEPAATAPNTDKVALSDSEIALRAYDPFYRGPAGFYRDERADTPGAYTMHHVKDQSGSYELCTDDSDQAIAWEEEDHASRVVQGDYVGLVENARYFEIVRELIYTEGVGNVSSPTSPDFARIFKCSYVNRDGVDRNLRDGYAGQLNARPLTADGVRTFVEYMWQFTFFWPARATVLESSGTQDGINFRRTLSLAITYGQGDGQCDLIELVDWSFDVNGTTGEIAKHFIPLRSFEAEYANGAVHLCGSN